MSWVTLAGLPCTALTLSEPRNGRWHAEAAAQPEQDQVVPLTGPTTLLVRGADIDQLKLEGVYLSGAENVFGIFVAALAGGKGDLSRLARPQHYRSTNVRRVLEDLLAAAGEKLSPDEDPVLLNMQLVEYTVLAQPVGLAIDTLLDLVPPTNVEWVWRFKPDGTLWVGAETWPAYTGDWQLSMRSPLENAIDVYLDENATFIEPGMTVEGRNVGYVQTRITEKGLIQRLFFEAPGV